MRSVGIDLGTASIRAATLDGETPALVADPRGTVSFPAVVAFERGQVLVGRAAEALARGEPMAAVRGVKWFLGRNADDPVLLYAPREFSDRLDARPDGGGVLLHLDAQLLAPEKLAAHLLLHVVKLVEERDRMPAQPIVVTVPPWLPFAAREAIVVGGLGADLAVERVVSDAAAIAVGLPAAGDQCLGIVDVGAGGVSASVVRVRSKEIIVLSSVGDARAGGDQVDEALVGLLLAEQRSPSPSPRDLARLTRAAAAMKHELSNEREASAVVSLFQHEQRLHLDRTQLATALAETLRAIEATWARALDEAGLPAGRLDVVYATGGMARAAAVRACLLTTLGRPPTVLLNPAGTAFGAARVAAMCAGEIPQVLVNDEVTALPRRRSSAALPAAPARAREPEAARGSSRPQEGRGTTVFMELPEDPPPLPAGRPASRGRTSRTSAGKRNKKTTRPRVVVEPESIERTAPLSPPAGRASSRPPLPPSAPPQGYARPPAPPTDRPAPRGGRGTTVFMELPADPPPPPSGRPASRGRTSRPGAGKRRKTTPTVAPLVLPHLDADPSGPPGSTGARASDRPSLDRTPASYRLKGDGSSNE